ncbi:MAG: dihydrodipicolinate synthase family protein [Planctomycetota bacterium]
MSAYRGILVPLPTPLRSGALDFEALDQLLLFHSRRASAGVIVGDVTGEGPTLSREERAALAARTVETTRRLGGGAARKRATRAKAASGKLAVIVAVGTSDTRSSCELARDAVFAGADALHVVTPPYVRPTRLGLLHHFRAIAEAASDTPLIVANDPERTGYDLEPEAARELARLVPSIRALLEVTKSPGRIRRVTEIVKVPVLAGDDRTLAPFAAAGASGAVSVVANLVPDEVDRLVDAARAASDMALIGRYEEGLAPLIDALSVETNPGPLKAALQELGVLTGELRSPLAELEPSNRANLRRVLTLARLLVPNGP